jgi:hypothetical protein
MEKQLVAFHKPNKDINKGTAIQITKNSKGLNLQLARQLTADTKESKGTYNWNEDSFSILINTGEVSKIVTGIKKARAEADRAKLVNATGGNGILSSVELEPIKLPHMNSTAPKTITVKFNEYPKGSFKLTTELSCYGTMSFFKDNKRQLKENQNLTIYLSEDETTQILGLLENELSCQLEDNFVAAKIVNIEEQDPKGHNGFKTINEFRAPLLAIGDIISGIKKGLLLEIVKKEFDTSDSKVVYYCKKVD